MDGEWHVTDLIFELRFLADSRQQMGYDRTGAALDCAADRIEKLEAALREIANHSPGVTHGWAEHVRHIARTTLSP